MSATPPSARLSKHVAYVLRHNPGAANLTLDKAGWVRIEDLLLGMNQANTPITDDELNAIVNASDKRRYEVRDGKIRAAQGHSIRVELGIQTQQPPDLLFHGTVARFLSSIMNEGLVKGNRNQVHLSSDIETALSIGRRRGEPVVLTVAAGKMHDDGRLFQQAANGVWLTEHVATKYIKTY